MNWLDDDHVVTTTEALCLYALTSPTIETVFSTRSVQSAYKRSGFTSQFRKYKRLKLGGGQAYDRSSE
jgi:hypothetical protein